MREITLLKEYDLILSDTDMTNIFRPKEIINIISKVTKLSKEESKKIYEIHAKHGESVIMQGHFELLELYQDLFKQAKIKTTLVRSES